MLPWRPAAAQPHTDVVRFADPARRTYKKLVLRDGRVAGAILLGDTATVGTVTQLFGGSQQEFAAHEPADILASTRFPRTGVACRTPSFWQRLAASWCVLWGRGLSSASGS